MKIYLAGPDVFRQDAKEFGEFLKKLCKEYGHEGLYPLDNEITPQEGEDISKLIYEANFDMIRKCDIVLANMIPFSGVSMDVGTAWEIGAAKALGKKVYLYNSSGGYYSQRVIKGRKDFPNVENFGLEDNLMLIHGADGIYGEFEEALKSLNDLCYA